MYVMYHVRYTAIGIIGTYLRTAYGILYTYIRVWTRRAGTHSHRLQTQEETPRKQGDTTCIVVFDVYYGPVFSESLVGIGVSSGDFLSLFKTIA